ncbi:hypothetical protein AXF42_Ash005477 [Apostasia shenzhenica]|uniref:Uncharacterized protein n=1 Tax=Apostasia shenzhenica TaxID=1088818 RepID=A0A2I0B724_9ASPA|nr:hypothetical protein AXF42_Ash005477 [Apostasia shenzhenica]
MIGENLLQRKPQAGLSRTASNAADELKAFRSCLRWMGVDHSTAGGAVLSWTVFFALNVAVPSISHFVLAYSVHRRPYDAAFQLSLSAAAALAFLCLSSAYRRYGLRRLLFLDELRRESPRVRAGYIAHLTRSFWILSCFVFPCLAVESAYKIWWYLSGVRRIPFLGNAAASDVVACALELASWIYRTGIFLLVCVLIRLICQLQILRLQDFATVFREESEVEAVLRQHLRIRKQLRVTSHRFRSFIVACLIVVTASQFTALLLTTRPYAEVYLFNTGELALCSITLVTGLLLCLRSAAKITHKAQALTSHAAKWHVSATIDSFTPDPEAPLSDTINHAVFVNDASCMEESDDENDDEAKPEDELEDTKLVQPQANTISFQKRQALVTYFENNHAGITIFGFVLDRAWLHTVFMLELSLFLWLLSKTIGIS